MIECQVLRHARYLVGKNLHMCKVQMVDKVSTAAAFDLATYVIEICEDATRDRGGEDRWSRGAKRREKGRG